MKYKDLREECREDQVENSQALIERLRSQLAQTDKADEIDAAVDEQLAKNQNSRMQKLIHLQKKNIHFKQNIRKLEAEVGPM